MIRFCCPACNRPLWVGEEQARNVVWCPCGEQIDLALLLDSLPTWKEESAGRAVWITLSVLAGVALGGLVCGLVLWGLYRLLRESFKGMRFH